MALLDFLFGTKQAQSSETTQIKMPEYMEKAAESLVATAGDVAKEGYIPYTGPRLAAMSQAEKDAIARAQAQTDIAGTQAGQAFTAATAAGAPIGQADLQRYMDPYMTSVADIAAREARRQSAIEQQGIAAQSAQAGAFGGSRQAVLEAERQRNLQQGISDIYTQAQQQAFQTALGAAQQERQQQLQSALGMGTTAVQQQALQQSEFQQQMGIGGLQRQMDQLGLDVGYETFLQERNYPKEQLGFYSNILRGTPYSETRTTIGQVPQPSFFQQAAGLGISSLGAAGSLGWQPFAPR